MIHLTVGYVAGFIAAAIFVARIWVPSVLTFILSGVLRDRNSAATWTVAARALQRSHWPNLLQSDSAKNHGVRKDVLFLTYFISLMGALVAVAGVVTPLGLYEALVPTDSVQTPFEYLKDLSPFGYGTPPRSNLTWTRICGYNLSPCPFTDTVAVMVADSTGNGTISFPYGYDLSVPTVLSEVYSSGVGNDTTVSNYFDIQWRRYQTTSYRDYNNGSTYLVGAFRLMQSLVLNNAIEPVEGLIVDTVSGGVGLRNHTVPPGFKDGATWEEDLLFIEPETVCVNTNTTLDYTITPSPNTTTQVLDLVLTDRGGFVNLNTTYPLMDLSESQKDPQLYARAYKAAWMTNAWTMFYYNVTNQNNETSGERAFSFLNSNLGKTFQVPIYDQSRYHQSMILETTFKFHLNIGGTITNLSSPADSGIPTAPKGFTSSDFDPIHSICAGAGGGDYANISNIFVNCGLLSGTPQRIDAGTKNIFDSGSRWSQPLYACASAVKATIKTVSFTYNGTLGLQSLNITQVRNKQYADDASRPLWGVENTGNAYNNSEISLIWGLVSSEYEGHPNVSTVRQDSLYLPGYAASFDGLVAQDRQNLPGSDLVRSAMGDAYDVGGASDQRFDYSGDTNMAMWTRWQDLTTSPEKAALIPNLIFTDYAAAAIVGTKGVLGPGNAAQENLVPITVTPVQRRIRYRWPFAIPAFIVVLGLLLITLAAFATLIMGHGSLGTLRLHLQQSSTGRIFTTFLYPHQGGLRLKTPEWSKRLGHTPIDLSGDYPAGAEAVPVTEKGARVSEYEREASGENSAEGEGFLGETGHARERSEGDIGGQGFVPPQQYGGVQQPIPLSGRVGNY